MTRFLIPVLGVALGVVGTFGPLAQAPAGAALSLCSLLGLLTLLPARGPRSAEIRRESFWHGAGLAGALTLGAGFLMSPGPDHQAWMTPAIIYSSLAALAGIVITVIFVLRARRVLRRPGTPRSSFRTVLLSVLVGFWGLMSLGHAVFGVVYAAAYLMKDLTPAVNAVAMAYAENPSGFLSSVRASGDRLTVPVKGPEFSWGCGGDRHLTVDGAPVSTKQLDDKVLLAICEATGRPAPLVR